MSSAGPLSQTTARTTVFSKRAICSAGQVENDWQRNASRPPATSGRSRRYATMRRKSTM
jgi:hypothetical protein